MAPRSGVRCVSILPIGVYGNVGSIRYGSVFLRSAMNEDLRNPNRSPLLVQNSRTVYAEL